MAQQIQFRRDTATNWSAANPILAQGEMGIDLTNNKFKIGDGVTAWNSLAYESSVDSSALKIANNLSDLANASTARTNIGLGNVANVNQIPMSYLTIDGTLSSNSDTLVPSEKAIKTYIDTGLSSKLGKDPSIITVADVGADFTTIAAAIAYVNTQSPSSTNQYVISVSSGIYIEPVLVVPSWTSIKGCTINSTIVQPSTSNHNVFELPNSTVELSFLTIQGAGSGYCGIYAHNPGNFVQMHKVSMYDNDTHIKLIADSIDSILYLEYVDIDNVYTQGIKVQSSGGFLAKINAENFYTLPTAAVSGAHLTCDGSNAQLFLLACGLLGTADIGIEVVNGGYLSAQAMYMDSFSTAIQASSFGSGAILDLNDIDFRNNTINIAASNANTTGQFTGYSEVGKITKHSSATFFVTLDLKEDKTNKSDDSTLAGHSSTLYPTQKAVKDYADTKVASNSAITGATKTKITYDSKGLVTSGADALLVDLGDVLLVSPAVDDVLKYNGTNWVNGTSVQTNAGSGVNYFLTATSSGIGSPTYDLMSKTPDTNAEVDETITVNNQTSDFESYISDTIIGGSQVDPGFWDFSFYTYTSLATGTNTITVDVYKRTSGGIETLLFSATSGNIQNTSVGLIEIKTVQGSFSVNATDKLLFKLKATTTNTTNTTIHLVHSGTTHYSFVSTPLLTRHNDLAGLQGGTTGQQYHLTSSEYTGTGTGNFVRSTSPTITTPTLSSPTITSPTISGATHIGAETFDIEGVLATISKDASYSRMFDWSTTASGTIYTTVGDYIMWGISHNFSIDSSGNILGRDDAGTCEMLILNEAGQFKFFSAPTGLAGTVPTFSLKATIDKDGFTGALGTTTTSPAVVSSLNSLILSAQTVGFTISGGTSSKTLTISDNANISGTNTGDQDLSGFVTKTTTVNGHALSSNVTVTQSDVGLSNVTNDAQIPMSYLDTDNNLTANSDTKVASQKAVKAYSDAGDALNVPKTTTVNGHALSSNVTITQSDVGLSNVTNVAQLPLSYLTTDTTLAANSDSLVPSEKAVKTYADTKQASLGTGTTSQFLRGDLTWQTVPNIEPFFGDGSDGAVSITTTVTLARDMYYDTLTISGAGKLITLGYKVYVKTNLDLTNAAAGAINFIGNPGGSATNGSTTAGTTATNVTVSNTAIQTIGINGRGGTAAAGAAAAAAGVTSTAPTALALGNGGAGGLGGAGGNGVGTGFGAGGGSRAGAAVTSTMPIRKFTDNFYFGTTATLMGGGAPGAGGGSGGGGGTGGAAGGGSGAGGSSGGVVAIYTKKITRVAGTTAAGAISAAGGNGGNGASGASFASLSGGAGGGGGGGGGGWVYIVYQDLAGTTVTNLIDASGGTGGNGGAGVTNVTTSNGGTGGTGGSGGRITLIDVDPTVGIIGTETTGAAGTTGTTPTAGTATAGVGGAGNSVKVTL